jgi:small GTP-binding protein
MQYTSPFIKILMVGDTYVGKSAIITRLTDNTFTNEYKWTLGIDFRSHQMVINFENISLQLWDINGHTKFNSISKFYYKRAHAIIIIYDVTNRISFDKILYYLKNRDELAPDSVIILVANKTDMIDKRVISFDEGKSLATTYNMDYIEVSAQTGDHVNDLFTNLVTKVLNNIEK